MVSGVEELLAARQKAREYLQTIWANRNQCRAEPLGQQPAVSFVMPSGKVNSASWRLYLDVMDQLKVSGGNEGVNYRMTFESIVNPGETMHRIHLTDGLLERAKDFLRGIEKATLRSGGANVATVISM